jgi:formylmethanofuran dehydrogenase subunit A
LGELDREYTWAEYAILTRAATARQLGLHHKGHLGPGADADLAAYTVGGNIRATLELPRYVFKRGELIMEQGELRAAPQGRTLHVQPHYDAERVGDLATWYLEHTSLSLEHVPVTAAEVSQPLTIACQR